MPSIKEPDKTVVFGEFRNPPFLFSGCELPGVRWLLLRDPYRLLAFGRIRPAGLRKCCIEVVNESLQHGVPGKTFETVLPHFCVGAVSSPAVLSYSVHRRHCAGAMTARVVPYGVYDLAANAGWVCVGIDHDTATFAVQTIRRWWQDIGRIRYSKAKRLIITAVPRQVNHGSNTERSYCRIVPAVRLSSPVVIRIGASEVLDMDVCRIEGAVRLRRCGAHEEQGGYSQQYIKCLPEIDIHLGSFIQMNFHESVLGQPDVVSSPEKVGLYGARDSVKPETDRHVRNH